MDINLIIDEAYELYMPQVRPEITELVRFIQDQMQTEIDICMGRDIEVSKPFNVLEIGTKYGGTFYIWNKLVQNHGEGMCISIDMSDGGIHGGISDEEMNKRDLWFYERFDNCHFIRGNSHSSYTLSKFISVLHKGEIFGPNSENLIDFLFIDGDHSYEGVKRDFLDYSPFVKPGGLVGFHDIVISDKHHKRNVYVGEFWNELKESGKYETIEFAEPGNDWAGIGLIKMK